MRRILFAIAAGSSLGGAVPALAGPNSAGWFSGVVPAVAGAGDTRLSAGAPPVTGAGAAPEAPADSFNYARGHHH